LRPNRQIPRPDLDTGLQRLRTGAETPSRIAAPAPNIGWGGGRALFRPLNVPRNAKSSMPEAGASALLCFRGHFAYYNWALWGFLQVPCWNFRRHKEHRGLQRCAAGSKTHGAALRNCAPSLIAPLLASLPAWEVFAAGRPSVQCMPTRQG
jgi:hypothetical protein